MPCCTKRKFIRRFFYLSLGLLGLVVLVVFIAVPLAFRLFPALMRSNIFVPDEEVPVYNDYNHPENYGFFGARNFYINTKDGATLGVWHTLPSAAEELVKASNMSLMDEGSITQLYDDMLKNATVFLYLHGSAGTRTSPHRLRAYRLLNSLGYHVFTYDYRGYGDSTSKTLNESDLTQDAAQIVLWINERVKPGNIFLWGHSLGSGVAAIASDYIFAQEGYQKTIKGIVLESPFKNVESIVRNSSLIQMFSFLPWFEYCFIEPLYINGLSFQSDEHLKNISTPVLILHAKDDTVLPYSLAKQLYAEVEASRDDPSTVEIVSYESKLGYGHYNITKDPNIGNVTRLFVERYVV